MTVAVLSLVGALDVAEVGSRGGAGDSSFGHTRHGWGVVTTAGDGSVLDIVVLCHDHDLADLSRVFEVTVVDDSCRVVSGHQQLLDLEREGEAPDVR